MLTVWLLTELKRYLVYRSMRINLFWFCIFIFIYRYQSYCIFVEMENYLGYYAWLKTFLNTNQNFFLWWLLHYCCCEAPDFRGDDDCVEKVAKSGLDVFAHNIETVEELQNVVRDRRANFKQSLKVLMMAKEYAPAGTLTKTSIMLGCGETPDQVVKTMEKVRAAGVDVMTFGQYMRPSKRHMPVSEYVTPEAFDKYQTLGMEMVSLFVHVFVFNLFLFGEILIFLGIHRSCWKR